MQVSTLFFVLCIGTDHNAYPCSSTDIQVIVILTPTYSASDYDEISSIYATDPLYDLINGPFKEYLGIPDSVVWSSQSDEVFEAMRGDFMKPVIDIGI